MGKHTPGPWRWPHSDSLYIEDRYGRIVAEAHPLAPPAVGVPEHPATAGEMHAQACANAALIAEAPVVLAELRHALSLLDANYPPHDLAWLEWRRRVRAAIAKAERGAS